MAEEINIKKTYENAYTMRKIGGGFSTSIPKEVVERKAKELEISVEKFIKEYEVVMMYDSFRTIDGAFIFRKKEEKEGKEEQKDKKVKKQ